MKFDKEKYPIYSFIADGMLSIPELAEGRLIPCIMFDKETAKIVDNLCRAHLNSEPGDVITTWVSPLTIFKPKELILKVQFKKPIDTTFGIAFNLVKHFPIIDAIVNSQALRIEAGNIGDKISQLKNADILLEVQRTNFTDFWEKQLLVSVKEKYKKNGFEKKKLNQLAKEHIKSMREIFNIRR